MAKEKDRTLPDRFEGASRGRWRSVGAAIAAGLGVFSVWGHFEDGVPESLYAACSLLAAGIALGAVLGFAPSGTRLDFRSGTYRAWYGWALPWLGRRGPGKTATQFSRKMSRVTPYAAGQSFQRSERSK